MERRRRNPWIAPIAWAVTGAVIAGGCPQPHSDIAQSEAMLAKPANVVAATSLKQSFEPGKLQTVASLK